MQGEAATWRIAPVRSREELVIQLRAALVAGALPAGQRMPNERQVAEMSGLSRSTVRLALDALERDGLIQRHVGRGTYVVDRLPQPVATPLPSLDITPAELMEFRLVIEPALVDMIVLKAPDSELDRLALEARAGREAREWRDVEQADRAFHQALFDLAGGALFTELGRRLSSIRDGRSWMRLKEGSYSPEKWSVYQQEHETIVAALLDRNAEAARTALRRHLGGVRSNALMASWEI